MVNLIGSPQSNSNPTTFRVLVGDSQTIFVNAAAKLVDGGKLEAIGTAGSVGVCVVVGIYEVIGGGSRVPEMDGAGARFQDTQKYTTTASNTTIYAEVVADPNAEFEADWNVTPTANSLEAGAFTDFSTDGKTLLNANSLAIANTANALILSTDATKKKSRIRLNLKESMFFA